MRGRLWKCAREQIREATNHESLGTELLTHDHLRQLLTNARSPQTLTEAVDVSAEWTREEDRDRERHSGTASMENDVVQQSADIPHSDQDSKAQRSEIDESLSESRKELTRMDQSAATESNRPMNPPPGLEDPNHVTEHPTTPMTTTTGHQNISRRPIPERRRHSHLRTAPIAHWIWTRYQRAQMRQYFQRTRGQGHQNFPSRHYQKEKCWEPLTPPRRCQVFQVKSQMLQSSLSIATECWILARRLAKGFIPNLSSLSFIRRASCR